MSCYTTHQITIFNMTFPMVIISTCHVTIYFFRVSYQMFKKCPGAYFLLSLLSAGITIPLIPFLTRRKIQLVNLWARSGNQFILQTWLMCPFVWFGSRDASVSNFSQCRKWWFNLVAQIMIICYWLKSNNFLWGRRGRKNWSSQWPTMLTNITNW